MYHESYLETGLHNHEIVLGGSQNPLAIICDIYGCDRPSKSFDGCDCSLQAVEPIHTNTAVFRPNGNVTITCIVSQTCSDRKRDCKNTMGRRIELPGAAAVIGQLR